MATMTEKQVRDQSFDRWVPPTKPITKPVEAALARSTRRFSPGQVGQHDRWICDGYVALRPVELPRNRTFAPYPTIADLLRTIPGKDVSVVTAAVVIDDPDPDRPSGPMFGGTKRKPRQGIAVRFADGTAAVYSKARLDYVASHHPRAALSGSRREAVQFREDGTLVGLVMPYDYQDGTALGDIVKRFLASTQSDDVSSTEKPAISNEEEHSMTPDEMINDDDAPVMPKPKAKRRRAYRPQVRARAKTKASANGRGKSRAKAKRRTATKPKASGKPKRERKIVKHTPPKAGSKFTATYKGRKHTMIVKAKKDAPSGVLYVVKGKEYTSPSSAARAVIDAGQKDGWTFWGIETNGASAKATPKAKAKSSGKAKSKSKAKAKAK